MFTRTITLFDRAEIKTVLGSAFSGYPWFESLDDDELERRWQSFVARPGFDGIALIENGKLVAAIWWDTPTMQEFTIERGEEIAGWVLKCGFEKFIWVRELVVFPDYQGRGIATFLRNEFLSALCPNTLVLTRHRNDNHGIIVVSKKQGFQRVGIKVPSKSGPEIFHEYWYKIV